MVVSFHFTKSQSRETGKCGVPSLASREAPHLGGSPPDSPRGGSLPSLGLHKGQEWRGRGRSDAIVSVHTSLRWRERRFCSGSREDNPREQLCPVGPGPAAAAHSGQHSSCPAAALSLRRRSLRTKMQAGPLSSRRTPLTASLPDLRLLGFPGRGRVGRSALQRHRATAHKLSELCPGQPEESGIHTGRGSSPAAAVRAHSQMVTDRMTPLPACLRSNVTKDSLQRNECTLPACLLTPQLPSTTSVPGVCPPQGRWGPLLASLALLLLV